MDVQLYTANGEHFGWTRLPDNYGERPPRIMRIGETFFRYTGYFRGASNVDDTESQDEFWTYTETEAIHLSLVARNRKDIQL